MRLTCQDIALRTRGRILSGSPERLATGASIDSRTVASGEAFFAIRGEVFDGHRFVGGAAERGASCVVVHEPAAAAALAGDVSAPGGPTVIAVTDTLRALQDLAASVRQELAAVTCGISGSAGKTTTKDLAALLFSGERVTHATPGNLNNHYGLPLAILRAPEGVEALILEMGISTPGEMDRLVEVARPDFGLLTVISPVHVGNFPTFSGLCDEKMKLPAGSRQAVLNADDPEQVARAASLPGRARWYGEAEGVNGGLRLTRVVSRGLLGSLVTLEEQGLGHDIELPLAGHHQARNLLAAAALARAAGVSWGAIEAQARLAEPGSHRGQVLRAGGVLLVDDSYNANPLAMRAALTLLSEVEGARRRILVAGDMLELGIIAEQEHRDFGAHAASRVDVLVAVGSDARHVASGAAAAGMTAIVLPDADSAGRWMSQFLCDGDVVLVKGSRGIGLDRAIASYLSGHGATRSAGHAGAGGEA